MVYYSNCNDKAWGKTDIYGNLRDMLKFNGFQFVFHFKCLCFTVVPVDLFTRMLQERKWLGVCIYCMQNQIKEKVGVFPTNPCYQILDSTPIIYSIWLVETVFVLLMWFVSGDFLDLITWSCVGSCDLGSSPPEQHLSFCGPLWPEGAALGLLHW